MTADYEGRLAAAEDPVVRDTGAHTSQDHKASKSKRPASKGASVTAPYLEGTSLPASPLGQVDRKKK
jgi:hypothetical protein